MSTSSCWWTPCWCTCPWRPWNSYRWRMWPPCVETSLYLCSTIGSIRMKQQVRRERAGFKFTLSFTKVCIFTVVCMTVYTYVQSHDIVLLSRYIQNHTLFPCGHSWLMSNLQFVVTMWICFQWLEMIVACLQVYFQFDNLFIL